MARDQMAARPALAVLVATGTALASHYGWWDAGTLQVKLALVVVAGALIVWHLRRPGAHVIEGLVRAGPPPRNHRRLHPVRRVPGTKSGARCHARVRARDRGRVCVSRRT
jgi:hypothetical protein